MDVSLSNSIMHTATAMKNTETANAVQVNVLKKSMDIQENSAAQLLQALPQPQQLAASGTLGTQVNTYA